MFDTIKSLPFQVAIPHVYEPILTNAGYTFTPMQDCFSLQKILLPLSNSIRRHYNFEVEVGIYDLYE